MTSEKSYKDLWISVNDNLPPLNQNVLVYAVGKHGDFIGEHIMVICGRYIFWEKEQWSTPFEFFHDDYEITHWMPLPDAPINQ